MELFEQKLIVYFTTLSCENKITCGEDKAKLHESVKILEHELLDIFESKNHLKETKLVNF